MTTARPVAVLDIGTNSLKLLVGTTDGRRVHSLHFARVTTRLGEGLHAHGRISNEAAQRTVRAIRRLALEARHHGAETVNALGTDAFRAAQNGGAVARRIEKSTGIPVRILTGREEAEFAFLSARSCLAHPRPATFLLDVGGGSAQFVAARGRRIVGAHSMPLGALRLSEKHLHHDPIDPADYRSLQREIVTRLRPVTQRYRNLAPRAALVAAGGSATTALAMVSRGRKRTARGGRITLSQVRQLERICLDRTAAERRQLPGLPADRADIIPAGIAVVLCVMLATRKRAVHVTGGGIREGAILIIGAGR